MTWNTHNIVAPSSWSAYDLVDTPVPARSGFYPIHPWQPTTVYTLSYAATLAAGTVMKADVQLVPITELFPEYNPRIEVVGLGETIVLPTQNKIVTADIEIQGPRYNESHTGRTDGFTLTIWSSNVGSQSPLPEED